MNFQPVEETDITIVPEVVQVEDKEKNVASGSSNTTGSSTSVSQNKNLSNIDGVKTSYQNDCPSTPCSPNQYVTAGQLREGIVP